MTKFVVSSSCGQYEDHVSSPIGVFDSREAATKFIESEKMWKNKIKSLAIKDLQPWEDGYDENIDGDYYKLESSYNEWLWDTIIGKKPESEITKEDYERLDDCLMDEWFHKYMDSLGYSEEVINATIEYNDPSDYSRYNTYYYITEVAYYSGA